MIAKFYLDSIRELQLAFHYIISKRDILQYY